MAMEEAKNQTHGIGVFREVTATIITQLLDSQPVKEAFTSAPAKGVISLRAGDAFSGFLAMKYPVEIGFITQARDEETLECKSHYEKLFENFGGDHAVFLDPMLATAGSAIDAARVSIDRGASGVTVVSAFATPQGVINLSRQHGIERIVTTPLEAGLNERGFIVGGVGATAMLGDFGDRFFGSVRRAE